MLFARDKYLALDGIVLPTACDMLIAASTHDKMGFWDDVYGFDMSPMRDAGIREASVEVVPSETLIAPPASFRFVDVTACADPELDFTVPFTLHVGPSRDSPNQWRSGPAMAAGEVRLLRCFVVSFDAIFDTSKRLGGVYTSFTTGSQGTPTHWKQVALYLKQPLQVKAGDVITGMVGCTRGMEYKRAYDITVTYQLAGQQPATQLWQLD